MELPKTVTPEWLAASVPALSDDEFDRLLAALRRQGWTEADIQAQVSPLRYSGKTIVDDVSSAGPVEETAVDAADATAVDEPAGAKDETVIEDTDSPERPAPIPVGGRLGPGAVFAGFVIEEVAGRGGMGVVYRARQQRPARTVALKVMSADLASDPGFRERFERESEISASIEHSNVIPVYGVGAEDGLLFIAMRYVEGTDLQATINAAGHLEPRRAVNILAQVTAALDAAHARGLVHRDVKPANVLMAQEGAQEHVYLTDFGLAKSLSAGGATRTGMFVGTLDYAAPEQFEGGPIDARTDVYAAGCLLYHVLTGSVPFPADTEAGKMRGHLSGEPRPVSELEPSLPLELQEVTRRAMAKRPDDRYLSAGDLGRAAVAAIEGRSTTRAERSVATGEAAPGGAGQRTAGSESGRAAGVPRWLKLGVPALAAVAGVLVAVLLIASGGSQRIKRVTRAAPVQSVSACMRAHGLSSPSQKRRTRSGESELQRPSGANAIFDQRSYVSCTSPPAPGANPDGYRAITVTEVTGPGESVASGTDLADRYESRCETLRLAYSFGSQQTFARLAPFDVNTGEVWAFKARSSGGGAFAQTSPIGLKLPFFPTRKEVDVLHSDVTTLDEVTCVR